MPDGTTTEAPLAPQPEQARAAQPNPEAHSPGHKVAEALRTLTTPTETQPSPDFHGALSNLAGGASAEDLNKLAQQQAAATLSRLAITATPHQPTPTENSSPPPREPQFVTTKLLTPEQSAALAKDGNVINGEVVGSTSDGPARPYTAEERAASRKAEGREEPPIEEYYDPNKLNLTPEQLLQYYHSAELTQEQIEMINQALKRKYTQPPAPAEEEAPATTEEAAPAPATLEPPKTVVKKIIDEIIAPTDAPTESLNEAITNPEVIQDKADQGDQAAKDALAKVDQMRKDVAREIESPSAIDPKNEIQQTLQKVEGLSDTDLQHMLTSAKPLERIVAETVLKNRTDNAEKPIK